MISPELAAAQALAKKLCNRELADGFTARDVFRRGWRDLATLKVVAAALEWLEEEGWIRSYEAGSGHRGGRPTTRYQVNPRVAQKPLRLT